ncbi:MAG: protein translocase subunit SecD [Thermoleophilaceae bacterium]
MTDARRNRIILAIVAVLLTLALLVIIPGSPLSKPTRLGLDLKGGVELVYQGRPTPKVPKVTPQAVDDAINTIRKRTDALGVSEPEIQRAGADEISIGLPAVKNAARAEQQVGTTAQLQFYDWEPNLFIDVGGKVTTLGELEKVNPTQALQLANSGGAGTLPLFQAAQLASKQKSRAEADDVPPDGPSAAVKKRFAGNQARIREYYDRRNDTGGDKYYLFGPAGKGGKRELIRPGEVKAGKEGSSQANDASAYYANCAEIATDFSQTAAAKRQQGGDTAKPAKGTACPATLQSLDGHGPPAGSIVVKVPRGIVIIKEQQPTAKVPKNFVYRYYVLEDDSELSGSDIRDPKQQSDPQTSEPIVTFQFTDAGRKAFARATKREAQRGQNLLAPGASNQAKEQRFAISLDNQVVSLATISFVDNPEGIPGDTGAQINGIGSLQETQDLAESLRIGALPISLKLISKTQVSATLGKQALNQGLLAGAAGLILTLVFLLILYRILGIIAGIALIAYAILLFALVKLIPITMTLPGIAGLVLTLGVAADANIVIFERIKEEARKGSRIPHAIASGYQKGIRTIVDANVVTIGVAFILFTLATAGVKGFAFTLGIGTLVSLFTAVLATSAILGSMSRSKILGSRAAIGLGGREHHWRIDFSGLSNWFFSMSGAIIAAGAIGIAAVGINFGIDFESGTRIKTPLDRAASVAQVRDTLKPLGYADAKIQALKEPDLGPHVVQIRVHQLEPAQVNRVQAALAKRFGVHDFTSESIGPTFGQQIAKTAVLAIIASLILISIYIGLRFEFKFAVPVLIALAHDLLITAGVYALTKREVNTPTVAALLTILGFSLYDTIIVFDRIRENVPRMPRATFSQIVNRSMSEVLTRSLATSASTLMPIAALMLFGGETLKDFGFALLVGVASGTYSSIFIAAPVLTHWKEREPGYRRRRQLALEDHGGVIPPYADDPGDEDDVELARRPSTRERIAARRRARKPATAPVRQPEPEVTEPEVEEPAAPVGSGVPGGGVPGGGPAAGPGGPQTAPAGQSAQEVSDVRARAAARAAARRASRPKQAPPAQTDGQDGGDGQPGGSPDKPRSGSKRGRKKHGRR